MTAVTITSATPDDWAVVRELRLAALRDSPAAFGSSYELETERGEAEWRELLARPGGARFLAYVAGEATGIVGVYRRQKRGPVYELISMWVRPDVRRSGVGRDLVDRVGTWVGERGATEVRLFVGAANAAAIRFYERLGFEPTGWEQEFPRRPGEIEREFSRPTEPTCSAHVVWTPEFTAYDFGPDHPLSPTRLQLTYDLATELGVLDRPSVRIVEPEPGTDDLLELVHDPAYIAAVRRASADPRAAEVRYGLGTVDDPAFAGMHDAAALIAGGSVAGARAVWSGAAPHAVNFAGGLHHAMRAASSGFCVYNDAAIAIQWLLDRGAERVAYVDIDVHHGDGVQAAFWDDPRVLTISIHESPDFLFPGTGYRTETGGPTALGSALNVPLPPGAGDAAWLAAFHAAVPERIAVFGPDILVTQQGCDSHAEDPLAHLALSVDAHRTAYITLHELAHAHAGGRWLALGGGGYAIVDVVPRSWTHLIAVASGRPLDPTTALPEAWRERVRRRWGRVAPGRMTDGA